MLSLDDELLRTLPEGALERLKKSARSVSTGELPRDWVRVFRTAQRRLERMHYKQRKRLLKQEEKHTERFEKMGLDPFTELSDVD
jgi:hypothetical protein